MIKVQENAVQLIVTGPEHQIAALVDEFKFRPASFYYAVSYQQYLKSDGESGWDGFLYPFRKVRPDTAVLPRGRKADLFDIAKELGIRVDKAGLIDNPFATLEIDDVRPDLIAGKFTLDDRQRAAILNWLRAGVGLNIISVGGGKTAAFAGAAALIKERIPSARFIYITPSERLVRQSAKEMRTMLPHFEVGQCGGGHHDYDAKDMVVCTVAILNRNFDGLCHDGFFDTFTSILFDECHHAASPSAKKVLDVIPAFFRLGASDTTKEKDLGKFNTIRGMFGPALTKVASSALISIGRLAKPHIYVVDLKAHRGRFDHISYRAEPGSTAFVLIDNVWRKAEYAGPVYEIDEKTGKIKMRLVNTSEVIETVDPDSGQVIQTFKKEKKPIIVTGLHRIKFDGAEYEIESRWCLLDRVYDRAVIQFKSRNDLIVKWTQYFHKRKWPTVVVATRTTHVYILEALLKDAIPADSVRILTGYEEDSPEQRDAMFEWFKTTPGAVLVTPLIKEGVSINEIKAMVIADYIADTEVARQVIGRAMRPKADNRAHVVWFWDRQNSKMNSGCRNLLETLEATEGFSYYHSDATLPSEIFSKPKQAELGL